MLYGEGLLPEPSPWKHETQSEPLVVIYDGHLLESEGKQVLPAPVELAPKQ